MEALPQWGSGSEAYNVQDSLAIEPSLHLLSHQEHAKPSVMMQGWETCVLAHGGGSTLQVDPGALERRLDKLIEAKPSLATVMRSDVHCRDRQSQVHIRPFREHQRKPNLPSGDAGMIACQYSVCHMAKAGYDNKRRGVC